jgi:mycothiol system anti-sigma-R factor
MKDICRQTLQRAYLILDGEPIAEEERTRIEEHLEDCQPCYQRYGIEIEMKRVISRLRGSETCPKALKHRIFNFMEES